MTDTIRVEYDDRKLRKLVEKFPRELIDAMSSAGNEIAEGIILPVVGLKNYPAMTAANQPPYPYYERGRGTWVSPGRNLGESERYGTQFYHRPYKAIGVEIGNRASYARYLTDETEQAAHMARIGWRKLIDVAREKIKEIENVYRLFIERLIRQIGG